MIGFDDSSMGLMLLLGIVGFISYAVWRLNIRPMLRYGPFLRDNGKCWPNCLPPPIGNLFQLPRDFEQLFSKIMEFCHSTKGKIPYLWRGTTPVLLINTVELTEQILRSPQLTTKGFTYNSLLPWLNTGLFTSSGEKWHYRRKLITPAFHFYILKTYFETIKEQASILIKVIEENNSNGKAIDARSLFARYALDVICETAMGTSPNAQRDFEGNEYLKAVTRCKELAFKRSARPYLCSDFLYYMTSDGKEFKHCLKTLHDFTSKTISIRQNERKKLCIIKEGQSSEERQQQDKEGATSGFNKKLPFLDLLLEKFEKEKESIIDIPGIREEVDTFMFGGHDTTSATLTWTLQCLGQDFRVQDKVYKEIDELLEISKHKTAPEQKRPCEIITFEDLCNLSYLDKVIHEVIRLFPPAPAISRVVEGEFLLKVGDENVILPSGTQLLILPYYLHHNPEIYSEPETFNPERFEVKDSARKNPYSYIPFSAGPRNCVGQKFAMMEVKITLVEILARFKIIAMQETASLGTPGSNVILRPRHPVMLKFLPRQRHPPTNST